MQHGKISITGWVLHEKAAQVWHKLPAYTATPMSKLSEGWLTNWKNLFGIKKFVFHGEDGSVVVDENIEK